VNTRRLTIGFMDLFSSRRSEQVPRFSIDERREV
jgi:hypothetical protein